MLLSLTVMDLVLSRTDEEMAQGRPVRKPDMRMPEVIGDDIKYEEKKVYALDR